MSQQDIVLKLFEFAILHFLLEHARGSARLDGFPAWRSDRAHVGPGHAESDQAYRSIGHGADPAGYAVSPWIWPVPSWMGKTYAGQSPAISTQIVRDDILTTLAGPVKQSADRRCIAAGLLILEMSGHPRQTRGHCRGLHREPRPGADGRPTARDVPDRDARFTFGILLNLFLAVFNLLRCRRSTAATFCATCCHTTGCATTTRWESSA